MQRTKILALTILLVATSLTFAVSYATGGHKVDQNRMPSGDWWVGYHAYRGEGYNSIPVRVFSVTSKIGKGVTKVGVKNFSDKTVSRIKFKWFLSDDLGTRTLLQQGETPLIPITDGLAANDRAEINFPVVAFEKVYKPLLKGNALSGEFRIQVVVNQVQYADGSSWIWQQPSGSTFIEPIFPAETAHGKSDASTSVPVLACADQTCQYNGSVYRCVDGRGELCTNNGDTCTSSACGPELQ